MRLYTFEIDGVQRVGVERDGRLVDVAAAYAASDIGLERGDPRPLQDMVSLIEAGERGVNMIRTATSFVLGSAGDHNQLIYDLENVRILAPILRPGKILCSGVNYRGHLEENPGAMLPETPGFFSKLPTAVIGPGDSIVHPTMTSQVDYEVELAVVIGRRLRKAAEPDVMKAVFGYTILHDVSARDIQFKEPQSNQITLGKNFDTFCPLGPCIVTSDELAEPHNLRLRTMVNGEVLQDGSTQQWVFPLPRLLAFLSQVMTLDPGDIVTTGTPAGVGVFRQPHVFLKPGDHVVVEVEGIGRLENTVVAEA